MCPSAGTVSGERDGEEDAHFRVTLHFDKIPKKKQLQGKRACLGSRFRSIVYHEGEARVSGARGSRSHRIHSQEAEEDRGLNKAACFLLFIPSQSTASFREEGLPTSGVLI